MSQHRESEDKKKLEKEYLRAVEKGNLEKVKEAIRKGVNINAKSRTYGTALDIAAIFNHPKIISYLISQGINKESEEDMSGNTALLEAIRAGNREALKTLVELGCNVKVKHDKKYSALIYATMRTEFSSLEKRLEVIKYLLSLPEIDINEIEQSEGDTALSMAAWKGSKHIVCLLLEHGANIDSLLFSGNTIREEIEDPERGEEASKKALPILKAAENLLKQAETGEIKQSFEDIFNILGRGLNGRRIKDGNTALHIAAMMNRDSLKAEPLLVSLLERGANPNLPNNEGVTPLMILENHHHPYIRALVCIARLKKEGKIPITPDKKYLREYKLSKELDNMMRTLMQTMDSLKPIELHNISIQLLGLVSDDTSPFYSIDKANALIKSLLQDLSDPHKLTKRDKEKTALTLLNLVARVTLFCDDEMTKKIYSIMMNIEYYRGWRHEAKAYFENNFKNEQMIVIPVFGWQENTSIFAFYIRIPPITIEEYVGISPEGYKTGDKIEDENVKEYMKFKETHSTLESLQDHLLTKARNKVAAMRAKFTRGERARE